MPRTSDLRWACPVTVQVLSRLHTSVTLPVKGKSRHLPSRAVGKISEFDPRLVLRRGQVYSRCWMSTILHQDDLFNVVATIIKIYNRM